MTIDEAIKQFKEDAEYNRADLDLSWAEENEQVAKWLEELKTLRYCKDKWNENQYKQGWDDAIDEFIDKFIKRNQFKQMNKCECINAMYVLAEQMKEQNNGK